MKKIIYILIIFSFSRHVLGQKEDRIWYFGCDGITPNNPTACLDFNSGSPIPLLNSVMPCTEGAATQCNRVGSLLFYTNGMTVWDRTHSVMLNGTGLGGHTSAEQSALIIPFPNDTNKFYLFAQDGLPTCPGTGLHYSIIDMTLNSGLGGVTAIKAVPIQSGTSEWLAGSKHSNGTDFWVVTTDYDSLIFYSYKVSTLGISAPVKTNFNYNKAALFKLDFNTKGNQLSYRCPLTSPGSQNIRYLADFNQTSGVLSNPIPLDTAYGNNATCFSPNDSLLYGITQVCCWSVNLLQYNLKAANIYNSKQIIMTSPEAHSDMKLGPNNKIYGTSQSGDSLDIIHNPNIIGTGCNFQPKGLYLGGRIVRFILPSKTFELAKYPLSISETSNTNGIEIFPNPTSEFINIETQQSNFDFTLTNLQGVILLHKKYLDSNRIDLTDIPNGLYFIKITSSGKTYYNKIVVRH